MTSKQKVKRAGKKRWEEYKAEKKACLTKEEKKAFSIAYKAGVKCWREKLRTLSAEEQTYQRQVYRTFLKKRYAVPLILAVLLAAAALIFLGMSLFF